MSQPSFPGQLPLDLNATRLFPVSHRGIVTLLQHSRVYGYSSYNSFFPTPNEELGLSHHPNYSEESLSRHPAKPVALEHSTIIPLEATGRLHFAKTVPIPDGRGNPITWLCLPPLTGCWFKAPRDVTPSLFRIPDDFDTRALPTRPLYLSAGAGKMWSCEDWYKCTPP